MSENPPDANARYTKVAIILHWSAAALLVAQIGFGWFSGNRAAWYPP